MMNLLAIAAIVLQVYALMMLWIALQTLRTRKPAKVLKEAPTFSVLVPFRNEAQELPQLLEHVDGSGALEWIFIDDGSSDESISLLQPSARKRRDIVIIPSDGSGKKAALATGARKAQGDVILTLDADVRLSADWFSYFQECLIRYPSTIWQFPLLIQAPQSFFQWFEALDVLSLTAATQAFGKAGTPLMANGAALAVKREFYLRALPQLKSDIASGDDVFLVHYASERKQIVHIADDPEALVEVSAQLSLTAFLKQRIRWGSKARHYKGLLAPFVAWLVLMTNLLFLIVFALALAGFHPLVWILIAGKIIADTVAMFPTALRFRRISMLLMVIPASILYPFYIVFTGIGGFFYRPDWKGRRL